MKTAAMLFQNRPKSYLFFKCSNRLQFHCWWDSSFSKMAAPNVDENMEMEMQRAKAYLTKASGVSSKNL